MLWHCLGRRQLSPSCCNASAASLRGPLRHPLLPRLRFTTNLPLEMLHRAGPRRRHLLLQLPPQLPLGEPARVPACQVFQACGPRGRPEHSICDGAAEGYQRVEGVLHAIHSEVSDAADEGGGEWVDSEHEAGGHDRGRFRGSVRLAVNIFPGDPEDIQVWQCRERLLYHQRLTQEPQHKPDCGQAQRCLPWQCFCK
jgi:hypothetical protein